MTEGFINGGFFVCDARRIWDYLPPRPDLMLEREPMQRLPTLLMQRRARALQARADDLFLAPADAPQGNDTPETP